MICIYTSDRLTDAVQSVTENEIDDTKLLGTKIRQFHDLTEIILTGMFQFLEP